MPSSRSAPKVLVIDDEPAVRKLIGIHLRRAGLRVCEAGSASEALRQLDGEVVAVVTDIDMPGMNGIELAKRVREKRPEIPVLFVSAVYSQATDKPAGCRSLLKPFDMRELVDQVQEMVAG